MKRETITCDFGIECFEHICDENTEEMNSMEGEPQVWVHHSAVPDIVESCEDTNMQVLMRLGHGDRVELTPVEKTFD